MKKNILLPFVFLLLPYYVFSQEVVTTSEGTTDTSTLTVDTAEQISPESSTTENTEISTEVESASKKEENAEVLSQKEERMETLLYGLDSEVSSLVSTLISEQDGSYTKELAEIFESASNVVLKDRIIAYFTAFSDESLKEYALYLLEDPYDEKNSTVNALINYVAKIKSTEAAPLLVDIIDSDESSYFNSSVLALGEIGGADEATYLIDYLENDLSTGERQSIVRSLAKLKAPETYDMMVEMVENDEENSYVRMYAAEAIGTMNPEDSTDVLVTLYDSTDPNLREYAVKGLTENTSEEATQLLLNALKDDHYKVRLQAIDSITTRNLEEAAPALLYRAKNDTESSVKYKCYDTLALFNYTDGIDYLIELLQGALVSDAVKANVASSLIKHDVGRGIDEAVTLALKVVNDDKKKNLRYALGKEFAKYENSKFEKVCEAYLSSKDVSTQGTGLDIYKKNPYLSLKSKVESLTEGDVANSIKAKAKSILESQSFLAPKPIDPFEEEKTLPLA